MTESIISSSILQNVLQVGHLDYKRTMDGLLEITKSTKGQFFEAVSTGSLSFNCKFSTSDDYIVGDKYDYEELPNDQYPIFHKSNPIAIISLNVNSTLGHVNDEIRQRIHDSICIGLVLGTFKHDKYTFTITVCQALGRIVTQVLEVLGKVVPSKSRTDQDNIILINTYLEEVITIIYDTMDYIEIDAEKIQIERNLVPILPFIEESLMITNESSSIMKDIDDTVPLSLIFDRKRLQQMLISILKKLSDMTDIRLKVSMKTIGTGEGTDYILVLRIYSETSRQNAEMVRRFQTEEISVTSLNIFVVKRLCEIMQGTFNVDEYGLVMTVKVDLIEDVAELLRGKNVYIATRDTAATRQLSQMYRQWDANVTVSDRATSSVERYALVILDSTMLEFARIVKRKGTPVLGLPSPSDTVKVVEVFGEMLKVPLTTEDVQNKTGKVLGHF
jgi:hypothetical protein